MATKWNYHWSNASKGQVILHPHRRTDWDPRKGGVAPAAEMVVARFNDSEWGTNDPAMAKALEASPPFKDRGWITRISGGTPPVPQPPRQAPAGAVSSLAAITAALEKLPAMPFDALGATGALRLLAM